MANKFIQLVSRKASFCKGKTTKASVRKAASAYIKGSENKTKARRIANKVLNRGCAVAVGKRKRKKGARRRRSKK